MPVVRKLLVALIALAACAAGLELYQRAFDPIGFLAPTPPAVRRGPKWTQLVHRRSEHPGLLYEMAPHLDTDVDGVRVRTNGLGFRGPDTQPAGAPGVLRVVAAGDSFTFGIRVEEADIWSTLLRDGLDAALPDLEVDVLNAGVCGYSTADVAALLAARWEELAPDVLVLGYFLNDPDIEPWQPLQRHFMPVRWWQHSHFLRRVAGRLYTSRRERLGGGDTYRYLHAQDGPCWPSVPAALERIAELCDAGGVPRLLVVFPALLRRPWAEYPYRDLHAQVRAAAEERGFEVLDLLEAFSGRPPEELLAGDGFHFNALGHELAAEPIAEAVQRLAPPGPVR